MGTFIIVICIVVIILYYIGKNHSKSLPQSNLNNYRPPQKTEKELTDDLVKSILNSIEIKVTTTDSKLSYNNKDSIIDVTERTYNIPPESGIKKNRKSVPYWSHRYVYSALELSYANKEQKEFYVHFKQDFLNGEHYDLEGNLNYAFILLFELLDEYESHRDIQKLEGQIKQLGILYTKTKSYGISFLSQKMEERGDNEGVLRLISEEGYRNSYNDDYWKLGGRYKSKLNLSDEEVKWLNHIWYSTTTFCNIEFCMIETIRLYLAVMRELKQKYEGEGTKLEKQILNLADIVARKHFKYRAGSDNYKYSIDSLTNEIYLNIFKHAENAVRDYFGHKRKVSTDTYYTATEAKVEFEKLGIVVSEIIPLIISTVKLPDEETDIVLYGQNTTRWKIRFEQLTTNFNKDINDFIENVKLLGKLNKKNPSVENIFYEASKFIAQYDKEASLSLYIHYLYHDLKSATFDNKQLTKTIKKNLFKTEEQLSNFEIIVNTLVKDKNLDRALEAIPSIYSIKRKRIELDKSSIKEVQEKHSGTVELLNVYLQEEDILQNAEDNFKENANDSIQFKIHKTGENTTSIYSEELSLSAIQIEVLEVFAKNNYTLPQNELEVLAKSKGIFKNQLIESINETCYEVLDDVLIEEDEDLYTVNENYYNQILLK